MNTQLLSSELHRTLPSVEVSLLGRRITCMTVPAIVDAIALACEEDRQIVVANYNVHGFNLSMQLPWYYEFLQSADIVHCDSVGIIRALRWLGLDLPLAYRASYTLLMPQLLNHCRRHNRSVYLLGGRPEMVVAALDSLDSRYPGLRVSGHHGYFEADEPVVEQIQAFRPDVLLVGMGMPTQEGWVWRNRSRLPVHAILTGGAVIDRLAGRVPDCPALIADAGLEWFWRLCREPKRLSARYLLGNPAFALQIALAKLTARPGECLRILSDLQIEGGG